MSLDDAIKFKLGTRPPPVATTTTSSHGHAHAASRLVQLRSGDGDQVDAEFDATIRWPRHVQLPADQRQCAASWIHSAAGRSSIHTYIHTYTHPTAAIEKFCPTNS